jgi:CRP-like cAMP-binding protein
VAIDALIQPLNALPLFRGLTAEQLTEIVRRSERIIYRAGEALSSENQPADAAIVIISGHCIRIDDTGDPARKSDAEVLPEGAMISELAMLVEIEHATTVIAQGAVKALRLTRQKILQLLEEDVSLAEHFSACITARLKLLANELKAIEATMNDVKVTPPTIRANDRPLALAQQNAM